MKQWRYFLAFVIASLLFFGIVFSEGAFFETISKVQPFPDNKALNEKVMVEGEETIEVLTDDGEFFRFYPKSEVDFSEDNRLLTKGEVFFSAVLLNETEVENIRRENQKAMVGKVQIPAGLESQYNIIIDYTGANTFITRDPDKKYTEIYAWEHAIRIHLPGGQRPFILPAGTKITVVENKIGDKIGQVSYSKLKKRSEFNLLSFDIPILPDPESSKPTEKIAYSTHQQRAVMQEMIYFASVEPETWIRWRKKSIIGVIVRGFQAMAIGYPEEEKKSMAFQNFVEPYVDAYFYYKKNNRSEAEASLKNFKQNLQTPEWQQFFDQSPAYAKKWNDFYLSQKALTYGYKGNNLVEKEMIKFWESINVANRIQQIQNEIFQLEYVVGKKDYQKAEEILNVLEKSFSNTQFSEQESEYVSDFRRILHEILKKETLLRKKDNFQIYADLIRKEKSIQPSKELTNAVLEENAQNLLYFLTQLLTERSDSGTGKVLHTIYLDLDIANLESHLGKSIFSKEDKQIIDCMKSLEVGVEISKDALNSCFTDSDEEDIYIPPIITEPQQDDPRSKDPNFIENKKALIDFFNDYEIDTDLMKAEDNRNDAGKVVELQFKNAKFRGEEVEGVFDITRQLFNTFTVNGITENDFPRRLFDNNLRLVERELENQRKQNEDPKDILPPQNPTPARIRRKNVQTMLENYGFSVSMDDIIILDHSMNTIEVAKAYLDKKYEVRFIFDYNLARITEVKIEKGRLKLDYSGEDFNYDTFADKLRERLN